MTVGAPRGAIAKRRATFGQAGEAHASGERTPDDAAITRADRTDPGTMDQQPGYNPYQPQQPAQHSPHPTGPAHPGYQGPGGVQPAAGAYNPYAPPTSGYEQPAYGMDMDVQVLAGRGTRLGAAIIDGLLLGAAMIPGIILVGVSGAAAGASEDAAAIAGGGLLLLGFLALAIYQIYLISTTGQSLAKKWLGIRIVKLDGTLPGFVHGVLLRSWVMGFIGAIPFVGGLVQLIDPLLIFGDERRCLHDHIAGTKVIVA